MADKPCVACGDLYEESELGPGGVCFSCAERHKFTDFADFARLCGLTRYPEPRGERYVYFLDATCAGKKSENTDFIDELWDALVRARGGDASLLLCGDDGEGDDG